MNSSIAKVVQFLESAIEWAKSHAEIDGLAVVGSHAKGTSKPDSDVDLVVITESRDRFLLDPDWLDYFGQIRSCRREDWGLIQSLRVFFESGLEVEFGFGDRRWVAIPSDSKTKRVISNGLRILFDPFHLLQKLKDSIDTQPVAGGDATRWRS